MKPITEEEIERSRLISLVTRQRAHWRYPSDVLQACDDAIIEFGSIEAAITALKQQQKLN